MQEYCRPESSERNRNPHELIEIISLPISPDLVVVPTLSSSKRIGLKQRSASMKQGFPDSSVGKASACNAGDPGSISGSGRSAEEGIGYPLLYSCPCGSAGETWV